MIAVLRHELASYFTNVTGYVFGAFLLLFGGIYTMVININAAVSNFEYVLSNMSFVFLVIVPILTMRVIAEERRQKTDQLLYALPIRMTQVALGKYLALLIVFLVPVAILGLFPLILSAYGDVYLPAAYGALAGFFFLGAALIAIGMFISSVTESQAVAAGLCFVVMLVNYFMSSLTDYIPTTIQASLIAFTIAALLLGLVISRLTRSFLAGATVTILMIVGLLVVFFVDSSLLSGRFSAVVSWLSLFERFYQFVDGVFDVTGIVYFLSVIGVFLFLTVQSLEKRRWSE
jgi:ABC-2 type transport system permease protein